MCPRINDAERPSRYPRGRARCIPQFDRIYHVKSLFSCILNEILLLYSLTCTGVFFEVYITYHGLKGEKK
jgi:hypothetical protein